MLEFTKRNPIRPHNVVSDQSGAVSTVKTALLNLSGIPPVSPVKEAGRKKYCTVNKLLKSIYYFR